MAIKFDAIDQETSLRYVETWFWEIETLATAAGLSSKDAIEYCKAGCSPGPIYAYHEDSGWWSALAAHLGKESSEPLQDSKVWYSPGSLWWLRRTMLLIDQNATLEEASKSNKASFEDGFIALLPSIKGARLAYPMCFNTDGEINLNTAKQTASDEWNAWTSGAYGVCLRDFTASNCIRKEALGTQIKYQLNGCDDSGFTDIELLEMAQELSSLVTPFSPWERENGTPGKTIDIVLKQFRIGVEYPYPLSRSVDVVTSG